MAEKQKIVDYLKILIYYRTITNKYKQNMDIEFEMEDISGASLTDKIISYLQKLILNTDTPEPLVRTLFDALLDITKGLCAADEYASDSRDRKDFIYNFFNKIFDTAILQKDIREKHLFSYSAYCLANINSNLDPNQIKHEVLFKFLAYSLDYKTFENIFGRKKSDIVFTNDDYTFETIKIMLDHIITKLHLDEISSNESHPYEIKNAVKFFKMEFEKIIAPENINEYSSAQILFDLPLMNKKNILRYYHIYNYFYFFKKLTDEEAIEFNSKLAAFEEANSRKKPELLKEILNNFQSPSEQDICQRIDCTLLPIAKSILKVEDPTLRGELIVILMGNIAELTSQCRFNKFHFRELVELEMETLKERKPQTEYGYVGKLRKNTGGESKNKSCHVL